MNIQRLFDSAPQEDTFLNVYVEDRNPESILPGYKPSDEHCVCIYGMAETEMDEVLIAVKERANYHTEIIKSLPIAGLAWDVECKPIFLFETRACAALFESFANLLDEDDFCEFISELQLDYDEPWTHVQMMTFTQLHEIIDYYEERFGYGFDSI